MTFKITSTPALKPAPAWAGQKIDHLRIADIAEALDLEDLDLHIHVGEKIFSYYPTAVGQAIIDLDELRHVLECDGTHDILLSGYPVLTLIIGGDRVSFHDTGPELADLDETFDKIDVEKEVLSAIGRIMALVHQS